MLLQKVTNRETIKKLIDQEPITNLNMIGALNYAKEVVIYVDDDQEPTGVYLCVDGLSYLYTCNMAFVDAVCTQVEQEEFCFSGVKKEIVDYMRQKYTMTWEHPCDIYYYPGCEVDLGNVAHEVVSIPCTEASHINQYYTFKSDESLDEIEQNLSMRPSAGIYQDGQLVCWLLIHEDDSMGIMYTMEGYRRRGYAVDVTLVLMDQILKRGKIPYLQILESNGMSPGLAIGCGFVKAGKCSWFGLRCT
ncbi:MAG: GNAT family N-acetyltransferase [Cellulosilyticaceae bacterium]